MTNKKIQEILSSTADKNLSTIKLLTTDSDFKELINKARNNLSIPSTGFDNDDAIKKWSNQLFQKSDEILSSKNFIKKELELSRLTHKYKTSYTESKKKLTKLYDKVPINYLKNRIDFIIAKFNLPMNYYKFIRSYIVTNEIVNIPCQNFIIGEYPPFVKPREAKFVPIKIFSRLTNDEIKLLKEEVAKFSKQLPKYQPLKNIDRDLEIEEWMTNRERNDIITDKTYNMSLAEIAEDLLGNRKHAKKTHEIMKDLKKTRKRRFNSSGKT